MSGGTGFVLANFAVLCCTHVIVLQVKLEQLCPLGESLMIHRWEGTVKPAHSTEGSPWTCCFLLLLLHPLVVGWSGCFAVGTAHARPPALRHQQSVPFLDASLASSSQLSTLHEEKASCQTAVGEARLPHSALVLLSSRQAQAYDVDLLQHVRVSQLSLLLLPMFKPSMRWPFGIKAAIATQEVARRSPSNPAFAAQSVAARLPAPQLHLVQQRGWSPC